MGSVELGKKLRALRRERGLTLSELQQETGISRSFLGLVEQGRSDISISRLVKLARAHRITLDELASEPSVLDQMIVVRAGEAPLIQTEAADVAVLLRHQGAGLAATMISYRPGTELVVEQTSFREAIIFVLDGRFAATVSDNPEVILDENDTLVFRGPVHVTIRCLEGEPARMLSVNAGILPPGPS